MANTEKTGGADSYLLYGVESTYGTAVPAITHIGLIQNTTPKINRNIKETYKNPRIIFHLYCSILNSPDITPRLISDNFLSLLVISKFFSELSYYCLLINL